MEEDDVKLLVKMNAWVSVVPHNKKWNGVIWKFEGGVWISHKKRVHNNPTKCYEWAANILEKLHIEYEENK